jgi:hypothetical protein
MSIDGDQRPLDPDSSVVIPFTTLSETTLSERSNMKHQPQVREPTIGQSSLSTRQIQHLDGGMRIARGSADRENMTELPPSAKSRIDFFDLSHLKPN